MLRCSVDFGTRNYRVTEFSNVMALPLDGEPGLPNWRGRYRRGH